MAPAAKLSPWGQGPELKVRVPGEPRCPGCGELLSGASNLDHPGRVPVAGDVTVCLYCASVLEYVPDPLRLQPALALVFVTGDELILALARRDISRYRRAVLKMGIRLPGPSTNHEGA